VKKRENTTVKQLQKLSLFTERAFHVRLIAGEQLCTINGFTGNRLVLPSNFV